MQVAMRKESGETCEEGDEARKRRVSSVPQTLVHPICALGPLTILRFLMNPNQLPPYLATRIKLAS